MVTINTQRIALSMLLDMLLILILTSPLTILLAGSMTYHDVKTMSLLVSLITLSSLIIAWQQPSQWITHFRVSHGRAWYAAFLTITLLQVWPLILIIHDLIRREELIPILLPIHAHKDAEKVKP